MNKAKLMFICFLIPIVIASQKNKKEDFSKYPLPNCVQLDSNLYCDRYEITNFNWLEYLHWNKKIFGDHSLEYQAALPDSNVWLKLETPSTFMVKKYLRSPVYRNYPVVGVTQQQARNFAAWRSDRVFEIYLIKTRTIREEKEQNAENYFTIKRYFQNQLNWAPRDSKIEHYPEYRLPNKNERQKMLNHNQSQNKALISAFAAEQHLTGQIGCDTCSVPPTVSVGNNNKKNSLWLYQLQGNVSEWLDELKQIAGNNWRGVYKENQNEIWETHLAASAEIGFRCVAEWKKVTDCEKLD